MNYACTVYLESNGQMDETLRQLRGHLSTRKFSTSYGNLNHDLSAIEQVVRVIVNNPPNRVSLKVRRDHNSPKDANY